MLEEIREHLAEAMNHCIALGMKPPFILCAVSPNGSVIVMRFNEGRDPDPLAQHFENDTFTMPINIMVVDRSGEAARVEIRAGKVSYQ